MPQRGLEPGRSTAPRWRAGSGPRARVRSQEPGGGAVARAEHGEEPGDPAADGRVVLGGDDGEVFGSGKDGGAQGARVG